MARVRTYPQQPTTVYSDSNVNAAFLPTTGWMDAATIAEVRFKLEVLSRIGNILVSGGYQTADVEDTPDTPPITVGSPQTGNGLLFPTAGFVDISSTTGQKQLIRFGYIVILSSGTTLSLARVCGELTIVERA